MSDKILPITMPKWGLTMKEGTIVSWLKEVGDEIKKGDNLVEIETEKVVNEFESPESGILLKKIAEENIKLNVGSLIGILGENILDDNSINQFVEDFQSNFQNQNISEEDNIDLNKKIMIKDLEINYMQIGEGKEKNILFIHGFGGDLNNWLFNQESLSNIFNTYALDLPGHGFSNKEIKEGSIFYLASIISEFCKKLSLNNLTLVGHSLGAGIAVCANENIQDLIERLILISPIGLSKEINKSYLDNFITADSRRDLKKVLEELYFDPSVITRDMINEVLKIKRIDGSVKALSLIKDEIINESSQKNNYVKKIEELEISVNIIIGSNDKIIPNIDASQLKKINYFKLENCGHMAHIEKSNEVNKIILYD